MLSILPQTSVITSAGMVSRNMKIFLHKEHSKYDHALSLPLAQLLERLTGVQKVMGSIPVGDSDIFPPHL